MYVYSCDNLENVHKHFRIFFLFLIKVIRASIDLNDVLRINGKERYLLKALLDT